ncbi:AsmA-like C-terminal region-containing protein [Aquimarina brevivitae]|uniref:AsmA-like protein n=1 Tax=Aquimarina brevivitae TaxID=323412 RepID=A0A4Q7NYI2_9FLAO|nr:AsmA-like C-terminal region-containing protein [Aquimarina brevivitae]RZS92307.1 AsmA-like protein [Aquimarina brevivitae]
MKKALKIFGILIVILVIVIIAVPFLFKGTIKDKIKYLANQHIEATVDFSDIGISLFRSFPDATVTIDDLSILNKAPFEGDTLAYAKKVTLDMSINEFFKDASESINVEKFVIDQAYVAIKTDSLGNSNYDIVKTSESDTKSSSSKEESDPFTFALEHYEINNSKVLYKDDVGKMTLVLTGLNHTGDGTVSGEKVILNTKSDTEITFVFNGTNYLDKNKLALDAALELDLDQQRYSFLDNKALVNQLPLEFQGYVQLFEDYTDVDLSFKTPDSDFKNFLAVIPAAYSKNIENVQTTGNFMVDGKIQGKVDDTYIPKMDINVRSNNASFKYPDLPKSVSEIVINTALKNETGLVDDTYLKIENLNFKIDQDVFNAKGLFKNLTGNTVVDLAINGTLNLANLKKAYPIDLEQELNGILKANINTHFDLESLEKEQYQNVRSTGVASITNFSYQTPELPNELKISNARVDFKPGTITLQEMKATTGQSDIAAQGKITNFMGFLFAKQNLKGDFVANSNKFVVNDFMTATAETPEKNTTTTDKTESTAEESIKIPSFLDANLAFDAKKVQYDNIELQNTKGSVKIKDETAYLTNVTSDLFGGGLGFSGKVSTKSATPTFGMNLDLSKIDIVQSFNQMELLKGLAPIARGLTGLLSTQLSLDGDLSKDLTPVLTSLKGNALAELLNAKVNANATPLISKLNNNINFLDLDNLDLKDIKTKLNFENGNINVQPFSFNVKDIKVTTSGSHSFSSEMNYKVSLDVPAKYLGNEASSLLAKLSSQEIENTTVPLPINISGNYTNPKIDVQTKAAIANLSQQIIATQKQKAKDKITETGKEVLGGLLGGNKEQTKDSTNTTTTKNTTEDAIKDAAKDVLGGLLGKKKKKKDTTKSGN